MSVCVCVWALPPALCCEFISKWAQFVAPLAIANIELLITKAYVLLDCCYDCCFCCCHWPFNGWLLSLLPQIGLPLSHKNRCDRLAGKFAAQTCHILLTANCYTFYMVAICTCLCVCWYRMQTNKQFITLGYKVVLNRRKNKKKKIRRKGRATTISTPTTWIHD